MADQKVQQKEEQTGQPALETVIGTVIRNLVTAAGGGLVTAGLVTTEELATIAGAVVVGVGLLWSWWQKKKAAKRTQEAAKNS